MKRDKLIGKYSITSEPRERGISLTCEVLDPKTQQYHFCKIIKGLKPSENAKKAFQDVVYRLGKLKSRNINSPIDQGFDNEEGHYFIIYPMISGHQTLEEWNKTHSVQKKEQVQTILILWIELAEALKKAQEKRIFHKDIHPGNILIQKGNRPILIDFGLIDLSKTFSMTAYELNKNLPYTAPELIAKKENHIELRSDIYSLGLCMLECLIGSTSFDKTASNLRRKSELERVLNSILPGHPIEKLTHLNERSIADEPNDRYSKYSDLIADLREFQESLLIDLEKPCAIFIKDAPNIEVKDFLEDLNQEGAIVLIDETKYNPPFNGSREQVKFRLATSSFFVSKGFIEGNTLKFISIQSIEKLNQKALNACRYIKNNGRLLKWKFRIVPNLIGDRKNWIDAYAYFEQTFNDLQENSTVQLVRKQEDYLDFYTQLLDGEKEYLRKKAFNVKYREFQIRNQEIVFTLNLAKGKNWKYIRGFINKSNNPHQEDVSLTISTPNEVKRPPRLGKAYRFNPSKKEFFVRDIGIDPETIPQQNGEIREDISRQEVQFSRQLKAIQAFKAGSFKNSALCAYLFNAAQLPDEFPVLPELDQVLSKDEKGNPFQLYSTQREAVRKILFQEPMTMIQGPPGTGKTTVIVESILQLIQRNDKVKILVTSQSNYAVDNVLAKLTKLKIPVIRLGDPHKIKQPSVQSSALNKQLKTWAQSTKKQHQLIMENLARQSHLDPDLDYLLKVSGRKGNWRDNLVPQLLIALDKLPKHQDLVSHINSRGDFEGAIESKLDSIAGITNYSQLRLISKNWTGFLANLTEESELVKKLVESVNVIGATSNHIASGAYSKFDFDFDYVIMDEAGKATPAEALVPISMGKNIVLVGDHLQLLPIVTTNSNLLKDIYKPEEEELLEDSSQTYLDKEHPSLFEIMFKEAPDAYKVALDMQRRMPERVSHLISKYFYEIAPHNLTIQTALEKKSETIGMASINESIILLDTGSENQHEDDEGSNSLHNPHNIDQIMQLLYYLEETEGIEKHSIGIISGYTAQTRKMKSRFSNASDQREFGKIVLAEDLESSETGLSIATVDSFQGLEKDIIIFDLVRSKPNHHLGFLEIPNRINVALSRVKNVLIIVGDIERTVNAPRMRPNLDQDKSPIQKMIQEITETGKRVFKVEDIFNV